MIWLAALQRYALPLGIVIVLGAGYAYHRVELRHARVAGYAEAEAEMAAKVATANAATAAREAQARAVSRQHDEKQLKVNRELQNRVDFLTARNVDLGRLRNRAAGRKPAAGVPAAATQPDGGADHPGHAVPTREDPGGVLGLQLIRYGAECERYRSELAGLQSWLKALAEQ